MNVATIPTIYINLKMNGSSTNGDVTVTTPSSTLCSLCGVGDISTNGILTHIGRRTALLTPFVILLLPDLMPFLITTSPRPTKNFSSNNSHSTPMLPAFNYKPLSNAVDANRFLLTTISVASFNATRSFLTRLNRCRSIPLHLLQLITAQRFPSLIRSPVCHPAPTHKNDCSPLPPPSHPTITITPMLKYNMYSKIGLPD